MKTVETTIYEMLIENTGKAICDSGGDNNRMWQRNASKTLNDFRIEDTVTFDPIHARDTSSNEICFTVSVFHYLTSDADDSAHLDLDYICREFNRINEGSDNWDSDISYGVSSEGGEYLENIGAVLGAPWNTYNGENHLSQILQGVHVEIDGEEYVLIQVHGGVDVRDGYTDARLFKYKAWSEGYINPTPTVYGYIDGVEVDTSYNGYGLTTEQGEFLPITEKSKVELYAMI